MVADHLRSHTMIWRPLRLNLCRLFATLGVLRDSPTSPEIACRPCAPFKLTQSRWRDPEIINIRKQIRVQVAGNVISHVHSLSSSILRPVCPFWGRRGRWWYQNHRLFGLASSGSDKINTAMASGGSINLKYLIGRARRRLRLLGDIVAHH